MTIKISIPQSPPQNPPKPPLINCDPSIPLPIGLNSPRCCKSFGGCRSEASREKPHTHTASPGHKGDEVALNVGRGTSPKLPPPPDQIDGRIDNQFHDHGGNHSAHHRCGDALHHIGARSVAEHNGHQAGQDDADGHDLGSDPLHGPEHDGLFEVGNSSQTPLFFHRA